MADWSWTLGDDAVAGVPPDTDVAGVPPDTDEAVEREPDSFHRWVNRRWPSRDQHDSETAGI